MTEVDSTIRLWTPLPLFRRPLVEVLRRRLRAPWCSHHCDDRVAWRVWPLIVSRRSHQGDAVRIMYVHVPLVWLAYLKFIVTALASAVHLFGKSHSMQADRVAEHPPKSASFFMAVTLVTACWAESHGVSIGSGTHVNDDGTVVHHYIGYLAVRGPKVPARSEPVAAQSLGLAVLEAPLVHWSVRL